MSDEHSDGYPYPESEKLQASGHGFGTILEFLEWLEEEKRIHLCKTLDTGAYYPVMESFQTLAYEFLGVDEAELGKECREMVERLQQMSKEDRG